jgi:hypothetical protein
MSNEILQLISIVLPVGIFYGATNSRIKTLEKSIENINALSDRLARIEEKTNLILNQLFHQKHFLFLFYH